MSHEVWMRIIIKIPANGADFSRLPAIQYMKRIFTSPLKREFHGPLFLKVPVPGLRKKEEIL